MPGYRAVSRHSEVPSIRHGISRTFTGIGGKYWTAKSASGTLIYRARYAAITRGRRARSKSFFPTICEVPMASELVQPPSPRATTRKPPASEPAPPPERLLDSDEAASIMKVHPKTLQKLARKGVVRGIHVGKLWRFRASTIEEWIQRQLAS